MSRILRQATIPHLYCHIDLSTHIGGLLPDPPSNTWTSKKFENWLRSKLPEDLWRKQEKFTQTMASQLLAEHVRTIARTVLPTLQVWRQMKINRSLNPTMQDSIHNFCEVIKATTSLRGLIVNDFSGKYRNLATSTITFPSLPHVSSLELIGSFFRGLNVAWLGGLDCSNLTSLSLDNVLLKSKALSVLDKTLKRKYGRLAWSDPHWHDRIGDIAIETMEQIHCNWSPAPWLMSCGSLRELNIKVDGERYFGRFPLFGDLVMIERYKLIRWLIQKNRKSLQSFRYEHSPRSKTKNMEVQPIRALNPWFGKIVYEEIVRKKWPCLREMHLQGIRSWKAPVSAAGLVAVELQGLDPIAPEAVLKIREAIGSAAKLVIGN